MRILLALLVAGFLMGLVAMHGPLLHNQAQMQPLAVIGNHEAAAVPGAADQAHASGAIQGAGQGHGLSAAHAHPVSQATDSAPGCAGCGTSDHHTGVVMACMLALLIALVLLQRPRLFILRGGLPDPRVIPDVVLRGACLRPPSLHVLCISRT